MDDYLSNMYYDPKRSGGFGRVDRLYKDVRKEGKFKISRAEIKKMANETRYLYVT